MKDGAYDENERMTPVPPKNTAPGERSPWHET